MFFRVAAKTVEVLRWKESRKDMREILKKMTEARVTKVKTDESLCNIVTDFWKIYTNNVFSQLNLLVC